MAREFRERRIDIKPNDHKLIGAQLRKSSWGSEFWSTCVFVGAREVVVEIEGHLYARSISENALDSPGYWIIREPADYSPSAAYIPFDKAAKDLKSEQTQKIQELEKDKARLDFIEAHGLDWDGQHACIFDKPIANASGLRVAIDALKKNLLENRKKQAEEMN